MLSIGEFSKICQVSTKTLRYYAEIGLILPNEINYENRYRYYYIDQFKPYDKAGAYGIQEWIGYIGIDKIEGSYFTIMGFPVHLVYHELLKFIG